MTKLYGFRRTPARTLSRIADTEGVVSRFRARLKYPAAPGENRGGMMLAKVGGTAIPAATELASVRTPGSGTVTLQHVNASGELTDTLDDSGAALTVTVINWSLDASGTNVYVLIGESMLDGKLMYINEPC